MHINIFIIDVIFIHSRRIIHICNYGKPRGFGSAVISRGTRIPRHGREMLAIKLDKLPLIRPGSIVLGISVFERTDYVTSGMNRKAGVFVLN